MTDFPTSKEDFNRIADSYIESDRFRKPLLFAIGREVRTGNGTLASVRYPLVNGSVELC